MDPRTQRVVDAAKAVGAEWALLTSPDSVAYAARHIVSIETGPSPFNGGPTSVLVGRDGSIRLICSETDHFAAAQSDADEIREYESLGFSDLRPLGAKYIEQVDKTLSAAAVRGLVAVEAASCPASVLTVLGGPAQTVWLDNELARGRAIKTEIEIQALRLCAAATGAGQLAARTVVEEGTTELHAWSKIRLAMEMQSATRIPVAGDFVTGQKRTARIGGFPTDRVIERGDPVICDLAPRINGYWGDSCTTFSVGAPSAQLNRMYRTVCRALEVAREALKPAVRVAEFDARVRGIILREGYTNLLHLGHGIGTSVHEWPRIVPVENSMIEPGMVLMVEPAAYHQDIGGVRLEQMFLITDSGHEVLSPFPIEREMPVV